MVVLAKIVLAPLAIVKGTAKTMTVLAKNVNVKIVVQTAVVPKD